MPQIINAGDDDFSTQRHQSRIDLAAAYRLAVSDKLNEGIANHFTLNVPGRDGLFYLHNWGMHWSEVTASSFMEVNFDGDIVEGAGIPDRSAVSIHGPIHRIIGEARCVMHTHMPYCTVLTQLKDMTLEMTCQTALMFDGKVAYDYEYNGLALTLAEGARMAEVMKDRPILMMANHGVLVTGTSVAQAYYRLYYLERACRTQLFSMWTGKPRRTVCADIRANFQDQLVQPSRNMTASHQEYFFAALKRGLDRADPSYAL